MANETFKVRVGFEAKTKAKVEVKKKVEVDKFSTVSRGANNNIKGLDISNSAAGLIVLIGLIILTDLIFAKKNSN